MTLDFKKGASFSTYTAGTIYFEKNTHLIKVGTGESTCEIFSGVRSASWNSTTKVLSIVNEAGENIDLNFSDVASAEGVNSILETLRDDINSKLNAPASAPVAAGQVLRTVSDGSNGFTTEWATLPAAVDYSVTVSDASTTTGYLKSYTFTQGGNTIAVIDIPKDLVVTSGSVVAGTWSANVFTEDVSGEDQALKLVIANQSDPVYIDVARLADIYTAEQNAAQVQITIDNTNEISATIVAGSIGATELDSSVNASLLKADSAIQSVTGETAVQNSSYVAVSVEASTDAAKAVTLSSHANVTTHDVSTAVATTADGLAVAADVKAYVDYKSGLKEWAQFE